ncbi:cellulose biosynthesis protein BcsE [Fontimonas thermophila]|uniref:Cellulose biosynthesis protein BcsE n=1 Tax=Fontimonas thermophila TaxID=1076937 RepID=A0A1I2JE98_9GAMM|nr:BcsE family c-di-GMP-binding protein [Fontimonas thermophila]SFF53182.1 cellulose biosynthesis protein BcsE [Fontimonas thermophila]
MTRLCRIDIDGLPDPLGVLQTGKLYALSVADADLAQDLAVCAARSALAEKRRIALVTRDPAATAAALTRGGIDAVRAHRRGSLCLFGWTAQSARAARLGPAQLLDELDAFGCASDTMVWLSPANDALRWDPPRALAGFVRLYHGWARMCRSCLVLVLGEHTDGEAHAQRLAAHAPALAGLALIHGDRRDAGWETRHWAGFDAARGSHLLRMQTVGPGRLICPPDPVAETEHWRRRIREAPDREHVYVDARAAYGAAPHWQVLVDAAAVEDAAANAIAASCIFAIDDAQALRPLARRLHRLRQRCGRGVRLFVRECGYRLRIGQAQMLLTLGANAIIGADEHAPDVVAAHREQPFTRPLDVDFENALRSALPPAVGGERRVVAFAEQVCALTQQAEAAGLACALISLRFAPGTGPDEARACCRPVRNGDLFCVEPDALHLFLYACWPEHVDEALAHVLSCPIETLFDDEIRYTEPAAILAALDTLVARAAQPPPIDTATAAAPVSPAIRAVQPAPLPRKTASA